MTGNLDVKNKKVINLNDPSDATDTSNKIMKGSQTFQGDMNMNNNHIKNVHTPTSSNGAVNKAFCETTNKKN